MRAALAMYDWPEEKAKTDALWQRIRKALDKNGIDAPEQLNRDNETEPLWTAPDLVLAETCSWPLATKLAGKVRYVATLLRDAPGCDEGWYRSAVIARANGAPDKTVPGSASADIDNVSGLRVAANGLNSLSGWVCLTKDAQIQDDAPILTGSHRASVRAVAEEKADIAAIDAYTWKLAQRHESAAKGLSVIGWTARRPALPLITALTVSDSDLETMRRAICTAVPAIVHDDPLAGL